MRRWEELKHRNSCWNKAQDHEMVFVLLGRDQAAAETIRFWCQMRVKYKKNKPDDPQILEALDCANCIEEEWRYILR